MQPTPPIAKIRHAVPKKMITAGMTACALVLMMQSKPGLAIDKIYSPNVTEGEIELEYGGSTTFDHHPEQNNLQSHEFEIEYGLTSHLQLELNGSFAKQPDESIKSSAVGFGGRYQFFEQGEKWLDSGILLTYSRAAHPNSTPDAIEAKLLLEKQWGQFLHRANIGFEQEVGSNAQGGPEPVFLWSSRYRYNQHFEPGFEIQSSFGKTNEHLPFNEQSHYIGPTLYGQIIPNLKYEVGYYVGLSGGASKGATRILIEYEMFRH